MTSYNFALTGAAGYVAPRHLRAIKDTGNRLVAAVDPHDSVGVLDSYFPDAAFFTEFERFDRHLEKLRRGPEGDRVQYVSICSPNHLHDAHIRQALRVGAHAICEKPVVLNPWNLDALQRLEEEYGQKIYTILQLRLHPSVVALKEQLAGDVAMHQVDLRYITPRGRWYDYSWKGDVERSGGIATNIGIHFFDLLIWLFGEVHSHTVEMRSARSMRGMLTLERAEVSWLLSIDARDLPKGSTSRTYRALTIDGNHIDMSSGFEDLHTQSYREILAGCGFTLTDAAPSIQLVQSLRA